MKCTATLCQRSERELSLVGDAAGVSLCAGSGERRVSLGRDGRWRAGRYGRARSEHTVDCDGWTVRSPRYAGAATCAQCMARIAHVPIGSCVRRAPLRHRSSASRYARPKARSAVTAPKKASRWPLVGSMKPLVSAEKPWLDPQLATFAMH